MKKLLSVFIMLFSVVLLLCGCENVFSSKEVKTTTTTTVTETTVQGNSELVTLAEETVATTTSKTLRYHSDLLSATFVIPNSWENKYAVEEGTDDKKSVTFYEKENHRNDGGGRLFTFAMYENSKGYKNLPNHEEYGTVIIDEITYYLVSYTPSDVPFDPKNKNLKKAYENMFDKNVIRTICKSVVFDSGAVIDRNGCSTSASTTEPSSTGVGGTSVTETGSNPTTVSGLVFPDISTRMLTAEEIKKKSSEEIQQAINDICAIHGYNFTTPSIKAHYQQFSWYKPSSNYSESSFNSVEKYNYELLQKCR